MLIGFNQWRATIGLFWNDKHHSSKNDLNHIKNLNFRFVFFIALLLITHGDIETNQGPKSKSSKYFSCCHWNVNSILAHDKLSLLTAYNSTQHYDIICISETYLDSSIDENILKLDGYSLIRADHPGNLKRGGVCLYYKENLLLRHIKTEYFPQCLLCRISIQNQTGYLVVTYRSPNQNNNEFNEFLTNFERLLSHVKQLKSSFLVKLGDFNARSKSWCSDDITTYEGSNIDPLTTTHGLHQLISQPTHLLPTSSTCIDLIFTDQPNLVVNSGTHPSFHKNCHHQITFCRLNLKIEYPPPYERLV